MRSAATPYGVRHEWRGGGATGRRSGGRDAAFAAHSTGHVEDPASRVGSSAHGAHGRLHHGMHKGPSMARPRATAAAAAAPPLLLLLPLPLPPLANESSDRS